MTGSIHLISAHELGYMLNMWAKYISNSKGSC